LCGNATQHQQIDTVGRVVSRTERIIHTTVFTERTIDSIVSIDSITGPNKISIVTFDTVVRIDTAEQIATEYMVIKPIFPPSPWKLGSEFAIQFNQLARVNWAAGGGNSYSFLFSNTSRATYTGRFSSWVTNLEWQYGFQQQRPNPWHKNQDRIRIESTYGFRASKTWYYSALADFNTQLTKGFPSALNKENYISRFLSPARFTFSLGMEYMNTPKSVTLFLSPIAHRSTYVMDTTLSRRFGIPANEHFVATFGPMVRLVNEHRLTPNTSLRSRLELLGDILTMNEPFVRMDWRLGVNFRVGRYLTLGLETQMIYDPAVKFDQENPDGSVSRVRKVQFQESIGVRFVYRASN
jgi:hypothetical protein